MARLNITWDLITGTFRAIWDGSASRTCSTPIERVPPHHRRSSASRSAGSSSSSATVIQVVIELILKLMNFPTELIGNIIANAMAAIEDIKRDPIEFLKNLLLALKQGFSASSTTSALPAAGPDGLAVPRAPRAGHRAAARRCRSKSIITLVIQVPGVTEETLGRSSASRSARRRSHKIRGGDR